jgi:type IV secretion system protein VirD4
MATIASILKQLIYTLAVAAYHLASFFSRNTNLHTARFARLHELTDLLSTSLEPDTSLLLGAHHLDHVLRVKPQSTRREPGNLLIAAPTRGGKGLLAVSQLLTWRHSVIVNDIKGELFSQTAGFKSQLGPVFESSRISASFSFIPATVRLNI